MASKRGCKGWMSHLTNFEKTLMSISVLLFLTLVLVILFGTSFRGSTSSVSNERVCTSKGCIETAGEMLSMMDSDVSQCSDFYSFACGTYSRNPHATSVAQESVDSVVDQLRKELETSRTADRASIKTLKELFKSCMNAKSYPDHPGQIFENVTSEVGLGTWPSLDRFFDESKVTVEERLVALSLLGIDVAFRWEIIPNRRNPGNYTIQIFPGGPTSKSDKKEKIPNLRSYVESILMLLGIEGSASEMNDIMAVESYFNEIRTGTECRLSKFTFSTEEPGADMNHKLSTVNWNVIINGLWKGVNLTGKFAVEVYCHGKVVSYASQLNELAVDRTVFNYLGWRFLDQFSNQLGPQFVKLKQIYEINEQGSLPSFFQTQGQYCLGLLDQYAAPLIAEIMTNELVDKQVINQVEAMTQDLKDSLETFVGSRSWINSSLAWRIMQKLKKVKFQVPSVNSVHTHKLFSEFRVDSDVFIRNVISLQKKKVFHELRKNVDGKDYAGFGDFSVISPKEKINYDGEILDLQFDKIPSSFGIKYQPSSLTYGRLGSFLSRQLSRYLLELYVIQDASPNEPVQIWDLWSRNVDSSSCIFNKFSYFTSARNVSDSLKTDILVDYLSTYLSYSLFKKHEEKEEKSLPGFDLPGDQLFFLAYAQTFCERKDILDKLDDIPVDTRINSAFGNLEGFSTTFDCASDTLMNPSKRCHL